MRYLLSVFILFLLLPASAFAYTNNTGNPVTVYYDFGKNYSSGKLEINGSGTLTGWATYDNNAVRTNERTTSQTIPYKLTFTPAQNYRFVELTISSGSSITDMKVYATNTATTPIVEFGEPLTTKPSGLEPQPPNVPTGLKATAGDKKVTLNWNDVTGATGYNVYQGGTKVTASPISTKTYNVSGLTNGTLYSFQVSAVNAAGESVKSTAVSATPIQPPPNAPTGLTATAGDKKVTLNWNDVTDATGYNVYQDGTKVTASPISTKTYNVSGLTNGTLYSFQISAVSTAGESEKSTAVSATPIQPPLNAPTGLTGTVGDKTVDLTWSAVQGATGYNVYQNGTKINAAPIITTSFGSTSLVNGSTYSFQVTAVNSDGESDKSTSFIAKPVAAGVPTNVAAKAGNSKVTITWSATPGATEYRLYRDAVKINSLTQTKYLDTDVVNGTKYEYRVSAVVGGQESPLSHPPAYATPGNSLDFEFGAGGAPSILNVIKSAFSFAGQYTSLLIFVLSTLIVGTIISFLLWLVNRKNKWKAAAKSKDGKRVKSKPDKEGEKKDLARQRKLWKARYDKYDLLTRTGRIDERDKWIKETGINDIHKRYAAKVDRRQRAIVKMRESARPASKSTSDRGNRESRESRPGRGGRNGRRT